MGGLTGTFTLDVEVATAFCGNGVAEPPEACDDGNTVAGDGCAPDCTLEAGGILTACPGQSVFRTGAGSAPRTIPFAGSTSVATSSTQSAVGCNGNGRNTVYSHHARRQRVDEGQAPCDVRRGGTLHVRSECDIQSSQMSCAGATEALQTLELAVPVRAGFPTYVFADSNNTSAHGPYTLDVVVTPGVCGDKILDGGEECDDGNAQSGDGCTADCKLEPVPMGREQLSRCAAAAHSRGRWHVHGSRHVVDVADDEQLQAEEGHHEGCSAVAHQLGQGCRLHGHLADCRLRHRDRRRVVRHHPPCGATELMRTLPLRGISRARTP